MTETNAETRFEGTAETVLEAVGALLAEDAKTPCGELRALLTMTRGLLGMFQEVLRVPLPDDPDAPAAVETHFPVPWDFTRDTAILGRLERSLGDEPDVVVPTASRLYKSASDLALFRSLTRNLRIAVLPRRRQQVMIPPDLLARFPEIGREGGHAIETPEGKALAARCRPFRLTAKSFAALAPGWTLERKGSPLLETWQALPAEERDRLHFALLDEALEDLEAPDLLQVSGTFRGAPITGSVRVTIHPLVIDRRKPRRAFYPITIEALVSGPVPVKDWTEDEQNRLLDVAWEALDWLETRLRAPRMTAAGSGTPPAFGLSAEGVVTPPEAAAFTVATGPDRHVLQDSPTRFDREALETVTSLSLPRKWDDLKTFASLEEEEVGRIDRIYGDRAYEEDLLRRESVKRPDGGGWIETRVLTASARRALRDRVGPKGFRELRKDRDGQFREYVVKRLRGSGGFAEVSLAWYGHAWPLVDEGRGLYQERLEQREKDLQQENLYEATEARRSRLQDDWQTFQAIKDGRSVMEYVLGLMASRRETPVKVEALDLRKLLNCEEDPNGLARVRGCLRALQELRFHVRGTGAPGTLTVEGAFIAELRELSPEPGTRGAIVFEILVSPGMEGSLAIFKAATVNGRTPFDWRRALSPDERKAIAGRYVTAPSVVAPFFDTAKNYSDTQRNLRRFLDRETSRQGDPISKAARDAGIVPVGRTAEGAYLPRVYDHAFCPLLEPGRRYHGALGHFGKNPETGRKLVSASRGLLDELGVVLPSKRTPRAREIEILRILEDLRKVIEEDFGGVVAGRYQGRWLSLAEVLEALPLETVLTAVTWFLFAAEDRVERMRHTIAAYHNVQVVTGETAPIVQDLRDRLQAKRERERLSLAGVGKLFGVSAVALRKWLETGIPAHAVPLVERWVSGGDPPTDEELRGLAAKRETWGVKGRAR